MMARMSGTGEAAAGRRLGRRTGPGERPAAGATQRVGLRHAVVRLGHAAAELAHAAADLALGSACAGCAEHPGLLCPACRDALLGPATVGALPGSGPGVRDQPGPGGPGHPGPALPLAGAAAYADPVRSMIIAHKEHGRLPLARPLGDALAVAVTELLAAGAGCDHSGRPVALVPVPSSRTAVRRRGHDPVLRTARRAAATLRRSGQMSTVVGALRHRRRVADQAGLGRREREANLRGSLIVRRGAAGLLPGRCVVLADDIVTTGATLREATRALVGAGIQPCGAVVVAVA